MQFFFSKNIHLEVVGIAPPAGAPLKRQATAGTVKAVLAAHDATAAPLFLYTPFQSVHCPIQVPDEYVVPYAHLVQMLGKKGEGIGDDTGARNLAGVGEN